MSLTCGERFIRCLTGQPVDHVPFGVGIGWAPWGETMDRWRQESGKPDLDLTREVGLEPSVCGASLHNGIYPPFEKEVLEEAGGYIVWRDERGILRRDRSDFGSMPEFLAYPVRNWADWEKLKAERLVIDDPRRNAQDWDALRARLAETGEALQVGWFPYGVFGMPRDLMGAEEVLVAFYDEPALVRDMMDHLTLLWIAQWEIAAAEAPIGHIHIWEDMSGRQGSLVSPTMVEEFMMPCYDRIAAFARAHNVPVVSVDTDGDCSELVPIMMRHGVNMFFPFEVQAGNDILAYRRQYPELGIIGGLDKRALAGSLADVDREIDKAARMLEHGRYIPGFDHLIPPDAKWVNYLHAAQRIRELCYSVK